MATLGGTTFREAGGEPGPGLLQAVGSEAAQIAAPPTRRARQSLNPSRLCGAAPLQEIIDVARESAPSIDIAEDDAPRARHAPARAPPRLTATGSPAFRPRWQPLQGGGCRHLSLVRVWRVPRATHSPITCQNPDWSEMVHPPFSQVPFSGMR